MSSRPGIKLPSRADPVAGLPADRYNSGMHKFNALISAVLLVFALRGPVRLEATGDRPAFSASSVADVIAGVNALRSGQGLVLFTENAVLDSVCQAQSDYMASISAVSDTDAAGRGSKARALAAGYPAVRASENVYWGTNASAAQAIGFWQSDAIHRIALYDPELRDVGAGVTVDGDAVFYCQIAALSGASGSSSSSSGGSSAQSGTQAQVYYVAPFVKSTPNPDGSIVHVIQPGDTLLRIANGYGIALIDLERLNTLTATTTIYPGRKLIIRPANTPTATLPSPTPTQPATATAWHSGITPTASLASGQTPGTRSASANAGVVVIVIAVLAMLVAGLMTTAGQKSRR